MKYAAPLLLSLLASSACVSQPSEPSVTYSVSFDEAAHHEAVIVATFTGLSADTLKLRMSRSSPGRYALHEFAKNVYEVSAVNGSGQALEIERPNPYQWDVSGHDGTVTVRYTLFADRADGTYSQIDRSHAHLNMPATFMWALGLEGAPIAVTFKPLDDSWKVATQLVEANAPYSFTAPNLAYFMDSPTELSDFDTRSWTVSSGGETAEINLHLHHAGPAADLDELAARTKSVVDEHIKMFGTLPGFDHGRYDFIACYLPHVSGDGMEHRNSTIVTSSASLAAANFRQIGTISHEFVHAWNVERLRPKALEPFDFTRANMTNNLWFAEGFTSYYGPLAMRRAGLTSVEDYIASLSGLVWAANLAPGHTYLSPEGASRMAPFVDAGTSIDKTNFSNTFLSYYTYGNIMALALDLKLRADFPGKSLDDYMRLMWANFGAQEIPYTRDDLRRTLGELVGDTAYADAFFNTYIYGTTAPDFAALMAPAGLNVVQKQLQEAYVGTTRMSFSDAGAALDSAVLKGTPLYSAGLAEGDVLVKAGGTALTTEDAWQTLLAAHKPGDTLEVSFLSRGQTLTTTLTLAGNPSYSIEMDANPSPEQQAFLQSWLERQP